MAGRFQFDSLEDLLVEQLEELYDAERRLVKSLPQMANAAHAPELADALREHERLTGQHVQRLKDIFGQLDCKPRRETSSSMKGLIDDGRALAKAKGDPAACDAALITAAQRVEHYEIASYGCARTFAQQLGMPEVAKALGQTLKEEREADKRLTRIAEEKINVQAAQ